jgi:tyrosine-specific transport protein
MVCGTAIGAGLVALPLSLVNAGIVASGVVMLAALWVAYETSCAMIDINHRLSAGKSIVECSRIISGNNARLVSMVSFYLLSFALLAAYTSCTSEIIAVSMGQKDSPLVVIVCGLMFYLLFSLKIKRLNLVNSILFALLALLVIGILLGICLKSPIRGLPGCDASGRHILLALPILFTSFGVQNICPYVYDFLDGDVHRVKKSFLVGISIVAAVYISWITVILCSIGSLNPEFYSKMLGGSANSGDLIDVICRISSSGVTHILIKGLSLLAMATSAIGVAAGLAVSLREILRRGAMVIIAAVPTLATLLIPNAFMNILAFGGAIATVFVVFVPLYLHHLQHRDEGINWKHLLCAAYAAAVVAGELLGGA